MLKKSRLLIFLGFVCFSFIVSIQKTEAASTNENHSITAEAQVLYLDGRSASDKIEVRSTSETKEVLDTSINRFSGKKYETSVEVEFNLKSQAGSLATGSGAGDNGICRGTVVLTYWKSGNTIKVEKCHGNWAPQSSSVFLSDRYVTYRGPIIQQTSYKYPSSNTFSYNTGWGYATQNTAGNGRAYTSVYTQLSGMGKILLEAAVNIN